MKEKKKHKLVLIDPNGREYQLGFLSPCRDGFVLGTTQVDKQESSHLTILSKEGTIKAHITPQSLSKERQYFFPVKVKDTAERLESLVKEKLVFQLSQEQLSEDILYFTKKFGDWYNSLTKALFQEKTTKKEIIYILNFQKLFDQLPKLVNELKASPESFFGSCKARNMLNNDSVVIGITNSGALILPIENELIQVDFGVFTNFAFTPSMNKSQLSGPIDELYHSLGITQYIQQEVMEKKFLENLLTNKNWKAATTQLDKKMRQTE